MTRGGPTPLLPGSTSCSSRPASACVVVPLAAIRGVTRPTMSVGEVPPLCRH